MGKNKKNEEHTNQMSQNFTTSITNKFTSVSKSKRNFVKTQDTKKKFLLLLEVGKCAKFFHFLKIRRVRYLFDLQGKDEKRTI